MPTELNTCTDKMCNNKMHRFADTAHSHAHVDACVRVSPKRCSRAMPGNTFTTTKPFQQPLLRRWASNSDERETICPKARVAEFLAALGCTCSACLVARRFVPISPGVELPRCPPHFKCWLEVVDKRHRYGANLRVYFKYWNDKVRTPDSGSFWSWLDGGPLHGMVLPECPECPRTVLDSDVVRYCAQHEQARESRLYRQGRPALPAQRAARYQHRVRRMDLRALT